MNAISAIRLLDVSGHNFYPEEQVAESSVSEICSKEEFHAILNCEKARADRNGHGFSIVSFESQDIKDIPSFIAQIKQRIRTTDEIGWFDHNTLGVFLYNTPAVGAWQFVKKNNEKMDDRISACRCSVYSYPNEWCTF
jgi:hypothetical protein